MLGFAVSAFCAASLRILKNLESFLTLNTPTSVANFYLQKAKRDILEDRDDCVGVVARPPESDE